MQFNLESLFQADPAAQELGLGMMGRAKAEQEAKLADMLQKSRQTEAMNPLLLEQQRLANKQTEAGLAEKGAQLPGIQADSSMKQDKAQLSRGTLEAQLSDMLRGYKFKDKERELGELEMAGRAYMQAEPQLATLPPPARHAVARRLLGQYYQPEFDQVSPEELGRTLNFIGSEMQSAQQKFFQAATLADKKAESAASIQDKKLAAQREIATYKAALSERLAAIKKSNDPKSFQHAATQLMNAARTEEDPDRKAALIEQAQEFINLQFAMAQAAGQAQLPTKPDIGAVADIPTMPPAQPPRIGGGNNPAVADPNMAKLPPGTKALGNGIYQLPDGTKIKANK